MIILPQIMKILCYSCEQKIGTQVHFQVKNKLKYDTTVKCVGVILLLYFYELTSARKPIACVSSVARAGVTSFSVVTSCIIMTDISVFSAFIHICSSNLKVMTVPGLSPIQFHNYTVGRCIRYYKDTLNL